MKINITKLQALSVAGALALSAALQCAAADSAKLGVGDPAPKLQVMQWIKGEPVLEFKKGHIYVVELWSTGCLPCIAAMPYLSELAQRYRTEATFIGVHTETRAGLRNATDDYIDDIRKFVARKGSQLDYAVAIDDPETSPVGRDWFKPAGQAGIPATFVINREGIIAAIDPDLHLDGTDPEKRLDRVLARVVEGSLDLAVTRGWHEKAVSRESAEFGEHSEYQIVLGPIKAAFDRRDYTATVAAADNAIAGKTMWGSGNVPMEYRLKALLHLNEDEGLAYARELLASEGYRRMKEYEHHGGSTAGIDVGSSIAAEDGLSNKAYRFALKCLKKGIVPYPDSIAAWAGLTKAHARLDRFDAALQARWRAMAAIEKAGLPSERAGKALMEEIDRVKMLAARR